MQTVKEIYHNIINMDESIRKTIIWSVVTLTNLWVGSFLNSLFTYKDWGNFPMYLTTVVFVIIPFAFTVKYFFKVVDKAK